MSYITEEQLARRLSLETVRQILDDDLDGTPDQNAVNQILDDSRSYIDEGISGLYSDIGMWPLEQPYPESVIRLQLDAAEAYAAKRHPEYVRRDWERLFKHVDAQIERLRSYTRSLAADPPGDFDSGIAVVTDAKRGW